MFPIALSDSRLCVRRDGGVKLIGTDGTNKYSTIQYNNAIKSGIVQSGTSGYCTVTESIAQFGC